MASDYPSQNAGRPTTDQTHRKWRRSALASPQTAGIPTTFQDGDTPQLNNWSDSVADPLGLLPKGRKKNSQ